MGIISAGDSDIGRKRKSNQDSICLIQQHHFYAVADGMGGHNGGDIASQLTVKLMPEILATKQNLKPQQMLQEMVQEINAAILKMADEQKELHGMGTTVSAIFFNGPHLYIANVGDSRVYLINNHSIFQLTRDHSFVQEKLNMGIYTRLEAVNDPQKNVLIRSVGFEPELQVDVFNYRICKNDIFIVCSDGLHGKVSDGDILHLVQQNLPDPAKATQECVKRTVKTLIDQANENGGQDNISVIIAVAQA